MFNLLFQARRLGTDVVNSLATSALSVQPGNRAPTDLCLSQSISGAVFPETLIMSIVYLEPSSLVNLQNPSLWKMSLVFYKSFDVNMFLSFAVHMGLGFKYHQKIFFQTVLCLNMPKIKCPVSDSPSLNLNQLLSHI